MRIQGIGNSIQGISKPAQAGKSEGTSFGDMVKNAVNKVNDLQGEADTVTNKLAAGGDVEIHQAMIAMQKASTALQFTTQVRNKVIEAYQEIMRMQV